MYTIFKNDSSIILSDSAETLPQEEVLGWSLENRDRVVASLEKNEGQSFALCGNDTEEMLRDFKKAFKTIEAAGGVVRNDSGDMLLIFRNEVWDLPKGKLDDGETPEQGALREVEEECGFTSLRMEGFLMHTYHIYEEKGNHVLKKTHWYAMHSNQTDLSPQVEEGITELRWFSKEGMQPVFENTYPNIRMLISSLSS
jgi:8-oxo-dGTP pyrophosphatase MutT (NUDIX family)